MNGIVVPPEVRKIKYDGHTWHTSSTCRYFTGHLYNQGKRTHMMLHRYIFEKYAKRKIAPGMAIHHKDHDNRNNVFDNLVEVDPRKHQSYHSKKRWRTERSKMIKATEVGRNATKAWHASDAGKAWHREHGKEAMATRLAEHTFTRTCKICGKCFESISKRATVCSHNCWQKAKYRENSYEITCEFCGQKSMKPQPRIRFCNHACSARWRAKMQLERKSSLS